MARRTLYPTTPGETAVDRLLNQTLPNIIKEERARSEREELRQEEKARYEAEFKYRVARDTKTDLDNFTSDFNNYYMATMRDKEDKNYDGGRITLGIEMRYKALNDYTSELPKLSLNNQSYFKGKTTESSIISGVQQGIIAEVKMLISDFKKYNDDFIVLFTGGDAAFFEKELKSSIFADQFLVLKGLNEILDYNADFK